MFAAFQRDLHKTLVTDYDSGDLFAQPKYGLLSSHVIAQCFNNLAINKIKNGRTLVYYHHFDAESRQHRGVLQPDYAGPDHDHIAWDAAGQPNLFCVHHLIAKWNFWWAGRARATCDQYVICLRDLPSIFPFNLQSMWVGKPCSTVDCGNPVSYELLFDHGHLSDYDSVHAFHQIRNADLLFELVISAIKRPLAIAG